MGKIGAGFALQAGFDNICGYNVRLNPSLIVMSFSSAPVKTGVRGKAYIDDVQIKDKGDYEQHNITFKLTEGIEEYKK
jgi:hypothetical protein